MKAEEHSHRGVRNPNLEGHSLPPLLPSDSQGSVGARWTQLSIRQTHALYPWHSINLSLPRPQKAINKRFPTWQDVQILKIERTINTHKRPTVLQKSPVLPHGVQLLWQFSGGLTTSCGNQYILCGKMIHVERLTKANAYLPGGAAACCRWMSILQSAHPSLTFGLSIENSLWEQNLSHLSHSVTFCVKVLNGLLCFNVIFLILFLKFIVPPFEGIIIFLVGVISWKWIPGRPSL